MRRSTAAATRLSCGLKENVIIGKLDPGRYRHQPVPQRSQAAADRGGSWGPAGAYTIPSYEDQYYS